jgi:polysaccharide export outer membrane protein
MHEQVARWTGIAALFLGLSTTSAGVEGSPRPSEGQVDSAASESQAPQPTAPYVLQVGDEIQVRAFQIPELEDTVRIRPDGRISLLLIDDVQAAGLTTAKLDEVLTARYVEFYRNPRVTVVVRTFANLKIYVGGEVGQPALLPLNGELNALGAILQAGGFRDSASRSSVILLRRGPDNKPITMKLNLLDVIEEGNVDAPLQPFDVVYVPKKFIAKANLFIQQYIRDLLPIATSANFSYILGSSSVVIP